MRTVLLLGLGALAGCDVVFPSHTPDTVIDAPAMAPMVALGVADAVFPRDGSATIGVKLSGERDVHYEITASAGLFVSGDPTGVVTPGAHEIMLEWRIPTPPPAVRDVTITVHASYAPLPDPEAVTASQTVSVLDTFGHTFPADANAVSIAGALAIPFHLAEASFVRRIGVYANTTMPTKMIFCIYGNSAGHPTAEIACTDPIDAGSQPIAGAVKNAGMFSANDYWIVMYAEHPVLVGSNGVQGANETPVQALTAMVAFASAPQTPFPLVPPPTSLTHQYALFAGFGASP